MENEKFSPFYFMAKPVGSLCNLKCQYCYYYEKNDRTVAGYHRVMSEETLEKYIKRCVELQSGDFVHFIWHGGEPMLAGLNFYRKTLEIEKRMAGDRKIYNTIQTNGTLIDDAWSKFFKENGWLVGVSVDGWEEVHDAYRRGASGCGGSFKQVMLGLVKLETYGVEWNGMAVVNNLNVREPERFYDFFGDIGCRYLQFTPIVERRGKNGGLVSPDDCGELTEESVGAEEWGEFLCRIFDRWVRNDVGRRFVQIFDATLASMLGVTPGLCTLSKECGHAAMMEQNGDLYSCDHFVFPEFRIGNINDDMSDKEKMLKFAERKKLLPEKCRGCKYLRLCYGECPKNRFLGGGENHLCEGYRSYFEHSHPFFQYMAKMVESGQSPARVMDMADKLGKKHDVRG
ncbi:MAG: anaerobic sulfatase maturase [Muribaculaceae bacterium]|nr:anaerobic sulfatase maturase [Muribaculaceae bacterium]